MSPGATLHIWQKRIRLAEPKLSHKVVWEVWFLALQRWRWRVTWKWRINLRIWHSISLQSSRILPGRSALGSFRDNTTFSKLLVLPHFTRLLCGQSPEGVRCPECRRSGLGCASISTSAAHSVRVKGLGNLPLPFLSWSLHPHAGLKTRIWIQRNSGGNLGGNQEFSGVTWPRPGPH